MRVRAILAVVCLAVCLPALSATAEPRYSKRTVIQPGAGIYDPYQDSTCTMGFLLKDPSSAVYVVTDGYCAPDGMFADGVGTYTPYVGSRTWKPGSGPVVQRYERKRRPFGRYVAQVLAGNDYDLNYAIIRVDRGVTYDGTVAVLRGPGRTPYTGQTGAPTEVAFVCMDGGYEEGTAGQQPGYQDGVHRDVAPRGIESPVFELATASNGICAGAPVLGFDGSALGIHSRAFIGLSTTGLAAGRVGGPPAYRLDAIVSAAQRQLRTTLKLVQSGEKGTTRV